MNAMKKYRERQVRDHARQLVNDNLDNFLEHMDVVAEQVEKEREP